MEAQEHKYRFELKVHIYMLISQFKCDKRDFSWCLKILSVRKFKDCVTVNSYSCKGFYVIGNSQGCTQIAHPHYSFNSIKLPSGFLVFLWYSLWWMKDFDKIINLFKLWKYLLISLFKIILIKVLKNAVQS
jgi:hypothetical protein